MPIFRIEHNNFERDFNALLPDTFNELEWDVQDGRAEEPSWIARYQYEAEMIAGIIKEKNYSTILEIGAGCGKLSSFIYPLVSTPLSYHLIDRKAAKANFEKRGYKGTFFTKDISADLDTKGLDPQYDLVICNDVLEHLLAPTNIVKRVRTLMSSTSSFFISVPNWRMAHQFIYRGLFDYDNFIYFMHVHGFQVDAVYPSPLQTPPYPKLQSESEMPDELLQSWNFYFLTSPKQSK